MSCDCAEFQEYTANLQFRNKSILDIVTKLGEQNALLNRAVFKSVTHCGCIQINASKQIISNDKTLEENKENLTNHVEGELCPRCREKVEEEIGDLLFYLASLCNALNLNLDEVMKYKLSNLKTLGIFNLL
ncbi:MAG: MazG nucleotide pyrophosphohydrolase domain-containing protein [Tissierellia bacterium]|nr:MazG nucleotide pyrophosphohydrolase domain-containing protein [Tissierellia bacterium]MDD4779712.1 MazG nucleotide pyrophosphohydrolase domain-containing protein [Tissierellia bacterium]